MNFPRDKTFLQDKKKKKKKTILQDSLKKICFVLTCNKGRGGVLAVSHRVYTREGVTGLKEVL